MAHDNTAAARLPDAPARLQALLRARHSCAFAWGRFDCAHLAFDAVLAVTGRDLFADLRHRYANASAALRLLRGLGGLRGLCEARLGPPLQPWQVQDGDVALLPPSVATGPGLREGALGVAWGPALLVQSAQGLGLVPRAAALAWWGAA